MARVDTVNPSYCGKHEKTRLRSNACPKCKTTAEEFMSPVHKVPARLLALTVLVFVVGIFLLGFFIFLLITTGLPESGIRYSILLLGLLLIIYGIWTIGNLVQIRNKGLIRCVICGKFMYSKAVWCIYCGQYIKWWLPIKWD